MQPNIPSELNLCLRCPGYGCVASIGIKTFCPTGFQTWSSSCCDRFMAGLTGLNYKIAGYRTLTFKMAASIWLKITRDRQGVAEWFILPGQIGLPRYASSITTLCDSNSAKVWVQRLLWQVCVFHRRIFDDWLLQPCYNHWLVSARFCAENQVDITRICVLWHLNPRVPVSVSFQHVTAASISFNSPV